MSRSLDTSHLLKHPCRYPSPPPSSSSSLSTSLPLSTPSIPPRSPSFSSTTSLSAAMTRPASFTFFNYRHLLSFFALLSLIIRATSETELKYNAGGWKIADFDPDPDALLTGAASSFQVNRTIPGLTVGLSHRWGPAEGFSYDFPTGNGQFDIDLIFAEIYEEAHKKGLRKFDVFVEDTIAFNDLDVFADAGADVELTKSFKNAKVEDGFLSIGFRKGSVENPMVSGIVIRSSNGSDISIANITNTEGVSENEPIVDKKFDHQAHAKAGGPYKGTDYNGNGEAEIFIDGTLSHSHYNDPDSGETGEIVKYEWTANGTSISSTSDFKFTFPVGRSVIFLTVEDQTGDTASASSEIIVLPSTAAGVYCYYYEGVTELSRFFKSEPLPDEGHSSNVLKFVDDTFPYTKKYKTDGEANQWAARCVTDYKSTNTTQYKFSVQYRGRRAFLFVNNGLKAVDDNLNDDLRIVNATVTVGTQTVPIEVWYFSGNEEPQLSLLVDEKVAPPNKLSYKTADIVPTISGISNTHFEPEGGVQMQIVGTGFFNGVTVTIGGIEVERNLISSTQIQVKKIPSAGEATGTSPNGEDVTADIVVTTRASKSNSVTITYTTEAQKGVAWDQTFFQNEQGEKYSIKQATTIKVGPDAKYYIGSLAGFITRLDVGKDLKVISKCDSQSLNVDSKRAILGMAFDPASREIRAYVTTSTIYWAFGVLADSAKGWANGAVETIVDSSIKSCGSLCMCREKTIVSGLPVSNHDHAVNALLFVDGDLLIAVGGNTNAGIPAEELGGEPETALSGAILIARLTKAGFNGGITYDQYKDSSTAKQTGGDVEVYAAGLRNCFGMTQHTNGQIWATDNGANVDYGDISTGCSTSALFAGVKLDEVNLIVEGKYYGHPNRNRAKEDPRQCTYEGGDSPKARVSSSTTGIVEYLGNAFSGTLQGKLILSRYSASGNGQTWKGTIGSGASLTLEPMTTYSSLSIENGLFAELVMPRVQSDFVAVLKPKYSHTSGDPFVLAVSPGRGKEGFTVFIGGEDFVEGAEVKFGAEFAANVNVLDSNRLRCAVPPGTGTVEIAVIVSGKSSKGVDGKRGTVKFIYV